MKLSTLIRSGLLALLLIATVINTHAQVAPVSTAYETYSQMWNTSNTYFGTITVSNPTQLGTQLDTGTNTTVLNLYTAQLKAGRVAVDTFIPYPVAGYGSITLVTSVLKCTGTPTVTATPVGSLDGIHWVTIPGVTAATIVPGSLTVAVNAAWTFPLSGSFGGKAFRYYGISYAGTGSSTYSAQAWFDFIRPYQFTKSG